MLSMYDVETVASVGLNNFCHTPDWQNGSYGAASKHFLLILY